MYLEVELNFKDGSKDWISPIEFIENDIIMDYDNKVVAITNDCNTYSYDLDGIEIIYVNEIDEIEGFTELSEQRVFWRNE